MGRPSQEYVDNSIKRLEEDRQKGTTAQIMERAKPIASDVWGIYAEAAPEEYYSFITKPIPESIPYIGGGGERAIETRRILDERKSEGKPIAAEFGIISPEFGKHVYETKKMMEKRFEERPWWQELGTSIITPTDWLLGGVVGKGARLGLRVQEPYVEQKKEVVLQKQQRKLQILMWQKKLEMHLFYPIELKNLNHLQKHLQKK